ncbi:hypothetical protein BDN72DRAFT_902942 [Pluteus cervinus]|uniref:Uncharacterized protein n=1 Tax=Pluteus cervinus TaxID=181527 RepID=A0ACD3AAW5_9AGAR|nr:hypothetical protein BDN72DRAFT_902942 [Pluteus cervinus]
MSHYFHPPPLLHCLAQCLLLVQFDFTPIPSPHPIPIRLSPGWRSFKCVLDMNLHLAVDVRWLIPPNSVRDDVQTSVDCSECECYDFDLGYGEVLTLLEAGDTLEDEPRCLEGDEPFTEKVPFAAAISHLILRKLKFFGVEPAPDLYFSTLLAGPPGKRSTLLSNRSEAPWFTILSYSM